MHCPFCLHDVSIVLETRYKEDDNTIKRKRKCELCLTKFVTFEVVRLSFPLVIKRDGMQEAYQRKKLEKSMMTALRKRPASLADLDRAIANVEKVLLSIREHEISSQKIGFLILEQLKTIDKVAYIRFASVYKNFDDISDFDNMLQELGKYNG